MTATGQQLPNAGVQVEESSQELSDQPVRVDGCKPCDRFPAGRAESAYVCMCLRPKLSKDYHGDLVLRGKMNVQGSNGEGLLLEGSCWQTSIGMMLANTASYRSPLKVTEGNGSRIFR